MIPGRVLPVPAQASDGAQLKIPAIGWYELRPEASDWTGTQLAAVPPGTATYFVHSFHVVTDDPAHLLASYDYGGHPVTAAIGRDQILGTQFHPEKSGPAGLRILEGFLRGTAAA